MTGPISLLDDHQLDWCRRPPCLSVLEPLCRSPAYPTRCPAAHTWKTLMSFSSPRRFSSKPCSVAGNHAAALHQARPTLHHYELTALYVGSWQCCERRLPAVLLLPPPPSP